MCSFSIVMERVFWSWDQMILIQIRCELCPNHDIDFHWRSYIDLMYEFFFVFDNLLFRLFRLSGQSQLFSTQSCAHNLCKTCTVGEGAYLLITYSFFSICMHQAKRSLYTAFPYIWCIFWCVICLCLCSICGWCEAAACVFELKTVFKKIFHWLNRFSCLYISVLQPTTSDDYPNFGGDFFSNKNISFCVYLVKFCYQFRCVFDEKNEQKHSKKFNSNLIFGQS